MRAQWSEEQRVIEGRPDTEQQAVSIISIHASKGLEWPVVIPVNMGSEIKHKARIALDAAGCVHLPALGRHGPGAAVALEQEQAEEDRQRHRLWYVAATRARDLLLLPQFSGGVPTNSFMEKVGLAYDGLTPFDPAKLDAGRLDRHDDEANPQDRARFETEAELIRSNILHIRRITPHLAEAGEAISELPAALPPDAEDGEYIIPRPRGSRARGLILHKLLEEVLMGETDEDEAALVNRAVQLKTEVQELPGAHELDPLEAAQTVRRGLRLGDILLIRHKLIPEFPILDSRYVANEELITQGVADAVVVDPDGQISVVVDWKSDVNPSSAIISSYRAQLMAYLQSTRAKLGILVFLTSGTTETVRNV
jgi:exodeoxyribonuclease-5